MSNIVLFNPSSTPVANQVTAYLIAVNTPDYDAVVSKVVNPTMPPGVAPKFLKVVAGVVTEMTQAEKDSITAAEEAAAAAALAAFYASMDTDMTNFDAASFTMANIENYIDTQVNAITDLASSKVFLKAFLKRLVKLLAWMWRHRGS